MIGAAVCSMVSAPDVRHGGGDGDEGEAGEEGHGRLHLVFIGRRSAPFRCDDLRARSGGLL